MFFTELVDAVRYSENWAESQANQEKARQNVQRQIGELDRLVSETSSSLKQLGLDPEYSLNLSKVINEFVGAAVGQTRQKLEARLKTALEETSAELNSEKVKTTKSLESYLSVSPLPILEEEVSLELTEGSYAASARFKCTQDIEYEFLLNTSNSPLLRSQFSLAAFRKTAKIPVRLGKAWLKKEPVPDFEKLEGYKLSRALASKNHLTAKLVREETGATFDIVYSKSEGESFVTVDYSDSTGKTEVTGEPALNKHLDAAFLKDSMNKLLAAIMELDGDKLRLARLEYEAVDVLATLDCFGFMRQVVKAISESRDLMAPMRELDPKAALDRLKLLGDKGSAIGVSLGLVVRTAKRQ